MVKVWPLRVTVRVPFSSWQFAKIGSRLHPRARGHRSPYLRHLAQIDVASSRAWASHLCPAHSHHRDAQSAPLSLCALGNYRRLETKYGACDISPMPEKVKRSTVDFERTYRFFALRQSHGATGAASAHNPMRAARAVCSNSPSSTASGAYWRYHHAKPARTISVLSSAPFGSITTPKVRPYLSRP